MSATAIIIIVFLGFLGVLVCLMRIIAGINRLGYHLVKIQNKVEHLWDTWRNC